ncbi:MAG: T9SS type A sorting domain-containing protein, partial [Ignavibacteria bacterium]|nr:T9SS type A sorting domain-containing protein [Ignavibacteria bacterium]
NFSIYGQYIITPATDPTNVTATPISSSQINFGFTPDPYNNNVVIVWNTTGTFTTPSGAPPAVGQSFAGGILLYNGTTSPVNHTGLTQGTTYYYKAFSNSGVSYSPGIAANASTFSALDFGLDFLVSDACNNSVLLKFGTAPGATECFDPGLDQSAPPPPPLGAFDGRFSSCGEDWFTDIRGTNLSGERIWNTSYTPASGCSPVSLSWDPAQLPVDGYFHLVDPFNSNLVNVNMRTSNSYTDELGLGQLQINYNYQINSKYNVATGWNMLSLPVDVVDNNYLTLFPNAVVGSLYGYSGTYFSTTTIDNCGGYWLKFPASEVADVYGSDRTECAVALVAGWNMIGGPNCNVPLSSVIDPGGIIIPGTLYGYSGSYTSASSIDGTKGYWIKSNAGGTITISCGSFLEKGEEVLSKLIESKEEFGRIEIRDGLKNEQTLYFNGELDDEINIESYSMPPVPPPGSFDARLVGDYRLTESDEVSIQLQATEYPVSIVIKNLNLSEEYVLVEMAGGVEVGRQKITEGSEIKIINEEVSLLKLTKQQSLPTTYNLEQNYPNPFNPSTTIKFSLPEASNVTLRIYNTLGQKVNEIINTNLEAGWYNYRWDASNVATGIYIYELRTDKFISVKKMLMIK